MGKGRFLKRLESRSRRPDLWEFGQMPGLRHRERQAQKSPRTAGSSVIWGQG